MRNYFGHHNHTHFSNLRLLDSINTPEALIKKAAELGLSGVAITDHESLSGWIAAKEYEKIIRKDYPNFKVALGNEIYLTDTRERGQKYFHFILIAKDIIGAKALKELSSTAWINMYVDRRMERVPTLKSELQEIISKYRGHVIATSACIGGELSTYALLYSRAKEVNDFTNAEIYYQKIIDFLQFCLDLFDDDFYIECAPSAYEDQIEVNKQLYKISSSLNIKVVVGTDSHYLTEKERPIHTAYLNSKNGERETDSFYKYAHLMDYDEVEKLLKLSFLDLDIVDCIIDNTNEIMNKIQDFSLERKQIIPKIVLPSIEKFDYFSEEYPVLQSLTQSDNLQERYWIKECIDSMELKGFSGNKEYWSRLETEADIIKDIGNKIEDCLFAYFNTFKHYIDLFWKCGSIVGPGRGSATGFLSNYLLGITQLDPIRWGLPFWRFLNRERAELPGLLLILGSCKKRTLTIA